MYFSIPSGKSFKLKKFFILCSSPGVMTTLPFKEVFAPMRGDFEVFVHRKPLSEDLEKEVFRNLDKSVSLYDMSPESFVDKTIKIVNVVRTYEICSGVDQSKFEQLWCTDTTGYVDNNPYDESRYVKTFRSFNCSLLVPVQCWRCTECKKVDKRFRERLKSQEEDEAHPSTKNVYLSEKQKLNKLAAQKKELNKARKRIDFLENKVRNLLIVESVTIEKDLGEELTNILRETKLTPLQQLFVQQQFKSATCKGATGMRWHPTLIRFSLLIKSTSSAAYAAIASSGVIKLPSERTLFDYSNAIPRSEGIFTDKLEVISNKVKAYKDMHHAFHNLLMDEIHICQKLVYRKSDGSLIGYEKLTEVEQEMKVLLDNTNNEGKETEPAIATKILAYMIRGCTTFTREVTAPFPTSSITKEQLFDRTWDVIGACEKMGVKILSVVCDGSSVNRAFFGMHTPATSNNLNVVFNTVNMYAPDRILHFISDPPHLLKTIRNCFSKSGTSSNCTRLLLHKGEYIVWDTIKRLYNEDIECNFRRCWKLTSQNVFLNSYSCMKVLYAAQVMSNTVAKDLEDRNWSGTQSTVEFISKVNNFFDCLNGAHGSVAVKRANERLAPYSAVNDSRFEELKLFEKYLLDWNKEVQSLENFPASAKTKMILSNQTLEGIFITINGFEGAMKYLLGPEVGAKYINAQVFCQDPLEQYFGKQRSSIGSRSNPTVTAFLSSDVKISIHRDLNVRRRSGNTASVKSAMEICDEPLPKRRKSF